MLPIILQTSPSNFIASAYSNLFSRVEVTLICQSLSMYQEYQKMTCSDGRASTQNTILCSLDQKFSRYYQYQVLQVDQMSALNLLLKLQHRYSLYKSQHLCI